MKLLYICTLVLLSLAVKGQTCIDTTCPIIGEPSVTGCAGSIDRYLARSYSLDDLTNVRYNGKQEEYCEDIKLAASLNAAFLRRVAGLWGEEYRMAPNHKYHEMAAQAVRDINRTYDCAGLIRPIVQACILEHISDGVNQISIPRHVLETFKNDSDYIQAGYSIEGSYYFKKDSIQYLTPPPDMHPTNGYNPPDLNRIAARMWYYYLAAEYIDIGYKGLHMGNIGAVAYYDQPGYYKTADLYNKIRDYAIAKGSFVLLDAHTSKDYYMGGTNKLLLDFKSSPIRPDEAYNMATNLPCNGELNTELNYPRYLQDIFAATGGVSPMGCVYDKTPVMIEFDFHNAICGDTGVAAHNGWCPWGYDESHWFHTLSKECQAYWVLNAACATNQGLLYRGYFQLPGKIPVFRMAENELMKEGVKHGIWRVNPYTNFTVEKEAGNIYRLNVVNPDCSSVYIWYVQRPDGKWLPATYGIEKTLTELSTGAYIITLEQNNLGLPPGKQTRSVMKRVEVE